MRKVQNGHKHANFHHKEKAIGPTVKVFKIMTCNKHTTACNEKRETSPKQFFKTIGCNLYHASPCTLSLYRAKADNFLANQYYRLFFDDQYSNKKKVGEMKINIELKHFIIPAGETLCF